MVVESAVGINWLPLWQPFVAPLFWLVVEVFARRVKKQEESKESDLEKATGKITLPADSSEEKATNIDHLDKSYRPLGRWKAILHAYRIHSARMLDHQNHRRHEIHNDHDDWVANISSPLFTNRSVWNRYAYDHEQFLHCRNKS